MISFMSMKKKKYKFKVRLGLEQLESVPFVTGVLFCKVRQQDGGSFIDFSPRQDIRNNCVVWNTTFNFHCKMTANANTGVLDPCNCRISVRKEVRGGRSHQKLGFVDLNLAQFPGSGQQSRRYLLEGYDAKNRQDNSTLKVLVELTLVAGDPVFKVPTVILTGDTGVIGVEGEATDGERGGGMDDHSHSSLTSISSGFSSLNRRGRLDNQAPDVCDSPLGERRLGLGHSRSASYASQQSDYSSLTHSRQSSLSNDGTGHRRTPSLGSTMERRRKLEESGKDSLGATRVDAEALVQELIENTDLGTTTMDDNDSGLQMVVQKDGTMALR